MITGQDGALHLMFETMLLITAAFGAGVFNTIAGGGTFLTFPALVLTGVAGSVSAGSRTLYLVRHGAYDYRDERDPGYDRNRRLLEAPGG